jgi:toxin-antitoxin system PIN domain toxin
MIAVDTNVLVHAHRGDSPFHAAARVAVVGLAEGAAAWAIPWPCVHEFLGIVTRASLWRRPSTPTEAVRQVRAWSTSPTVHLLSEDDRSLDLVLDLVERSGVAGAKVHDARIVALCLGHGVRELWTADRDFSRFPALRTHNPLAG